MYYTLVHYNLFSPTLSTWSSRLLLRRDKAARTVLLLLSLGWAWFAGIIPTLPIGRVRCLLLPQIGTCRRASPPFHQRPHDISRFDPIPVHASHRVFPVLHPVSRISLINPRHLQPVVHHHISLRLRSPHKDRLSIAELLDLLLGQGLACNRQFRTRRFWWLLLLLLRFQRLQDSCDLRALFIRVVADPLDHRLLEAILLDPLRQAAVAELPVHLRGLERMPIQGEGYALDLLRWIATPINKGCDDLSFY